MIAVQLPAGAPLCARQLVTFMSALSDSERALSPTSREFRIALARVVARSSVAVMMTRSELRMAVAYLRKVGAL